MHLHKTQDIYPLLTNTARATMKEQLCTDLSHNHKLIYNTLGF